MLAGFCGVWRVTNVMHRGPALLSLCHHRLFGRLLARVVPPILESDPMTLPLVLLAFREPGVFLSWLAVAFFLSHAR